MQLSLYDYLPFFNNGFVTVTFSQKCFLAFAPTKGLEAEGRFVVVVSGFYCNFIFWAFLGVGGGVW